MLLKVLSALELVPQRSGEITDILRGRGGGTVLLHWVAQLMVFRVFAEEEALLAHVKVEAL